MKNQGKSKNSSATAEFLTMLGIVGIIVIYLFYLIVDLLR